MESIGTAYKTLTMLKNGEVGPEGPPGPTLDWIEDWNGTKVEIGDTRIVTPRIFAGGINTATKEVTGVAMGRNIFGNNQGYPLDSGLAGYKNGIKTFHLTTNGELLIGSESGNYLSFNGEEFELRASRISIGVSSVTTQDEVDNKITDTQNEINGTINSAMSTVQGNVLQEVSDSYTTKGESSALNSKVESYFEQTAGNIELSFAQSNKNLNDYKSYMETYIRFGIDGMELGKSDSPFKTKLSNQKLSFLQDNSEVAYIQFNKMFITEAEIIDTLRIGEREKGFFIWSQGSEGNLSLKWSE